MLKMFVVSFGWFILFTNILSWFMDLFYVITNTNRPKPSNISKFIGLTLNPISILWLIYILIYKL